MGALGPNNLQSRQGLAQDRGDLRKTLGIRFDIRLLTMVQAVDEFVRDTANQRFHVLTLF